MNKRRLISFIICIILGFSFVTGCSKPIEEEIEATPTPVLINETDIYLVNNGKTDYKIIVPENAHSYVDYAAQELKFYFAQATGIELDVLRDNEVSSIAGGKYITLGPVNYLEDVGITVSKDSLGSAGFVIKRVDSNVHICGGDYLGTLYGAYEFLKYQFNYEVYSIDEIALDSNVTKKKLLDLDLTDKPDIPYRHAFGDKHYSSSVNAGKLRLNIMQEAFVEDASAQPWHNTLRILPVSEYKAEHPDWYMPGNQQLSYTANGNEEELALMRAEVVKKMKGYITKSYSEGKYLELIGFMHEDNGDWATDASMDIYEEKYGSAAPAASLIHFLNPVAKEIKAFMQENYPGYEMNIVTFAYWTTEEAPVKRVDGEYVPIDDSVILEDNLMVFYAPIRANYLEDFEHSTNKSYKDTLDKWSVLTDKFSFWIYTTNFTDYLMFYDSFNSMQSIYQMAVDYNAFFFFNESAWNYGNTAFNALKEYVGSKLQWNVNADMSLLIDNFFENYYKEAAAPVRKIFESLRIYTAYLKEQYYLTGGVFTDMDSKTYWPQGVVDGYLKQLDEAYASIEHLKASNPERYSLLYDRICGEGLFFRYIKMKYYATIFSDEEFDAEFKQFKEDCERLKIGALSIYTKIKDLQLTK